MSEPIQGKYDRDWSGLFYYDEDSPTGLRWAVDRYAGRLYNILVCAAGSVAGTRSGAYWYVSIGGEKFAAHRVIVTLCKGADVDSCEIDHKDGDGLNNKLDNLRVVSRTLNAQNVSLRSDNTSSVVGVCYRERETKWATYRYWEANWWVDNRQLSKSFSITKLGHAEAFRQACEHRAKMINALNQQGAGYTGRHGKENDDSDG